MPSSSNKSAFREFLQIIKLRHSVYAQTLRITARSIDIFYVHTSCPGVELELLFELEVAIDQVCLVYTVSTDYIDILRPLASLAKPEVKPINFNTS